MRLSVNLPVEGLTNNRGACLGRDEKLSLLADNVTNLEISWTGVLGKRPLDEGGLLAKATYEDLKE